MAFFIESWYMLDFIVAWVYWASLLSSASRSASISDATDW